MASRQPLDARQEAEAARLLKDNWIGKQPMRTRVALWLLLAATWPSAVVGVLTALAGWNGWLAWLLTSVAAAGLYSYAIFWPGRAARYGGSQLMTQAEEQRLRDLPPPPVARGF